MSFQSIKGGYKKKQWFEEEIKAIQQRNMGHKKINFCSRIKMVFSIFWRYQIKLLVF